MRAEVFPRKKKKKDGLIKKKNGFIVFVALRNSISLLDGLCYEIIWDHQMYKKFFHLSQNVNHFHWRKKTWKLKEYKITKKNEYDS